MKLWKKHLVGAICLAFITPILWCFGDIVGKQPGMHWFDTCMYSWSILCAAGVFGEVIAAVHCGTGDIGDVVE